jgi:transglycosylase-like protein
MITILIAATCTTGALAARPDRPVTGNQAQFEGHRNGDQSWQWNWQVWLPEKWQRIGACETGYGQRPGRWDWNSGTYQGAFGFAVSSWDQFKPVSWWPDEAYDATPWQQYVVALEIHKRYGFSGWGCRNA